MFSKIFSITILLFRNTLVNGQYGDYSMYNDYIKYLHKYNKYVHQYEFDKRFNTFLDNHKLVNDHNSDLNNSFKLELNNFADISNYHMFTGYNLNITKTRECNTYSNNNYNNLPIEIDWRNKLTTPVKDQGQCGSCWSFSATGAMEGAWALETGELISLSEQQLMDCSKWYGDMGCNGGLMDNAFEYAIDHGMCSENDVPYTAAVDNCETSYCSVVATFSSCVDIPQGNQLAMKAAVSKQPISVAIQADKAVFQLYSSGVLDSDSCGTQIDHGVLIVGYGTENNQDYWLVKNSWGNTWGDEGYIKIARSESDNDIGVCGIATFPSFPVATVN